MIKFLTLPVAPFHFLQGAQENLELFQVFHWQVGKWGDRARTSKRRTLNQLRCSASSGYVCSYPIMIAKLRLIVLHFVGYSKTQARVL